MTAPRLRRTSRKFRRFDATVRRWLERSSPQRRAAFTTSSVYGVEGGRGAILRAMRAADRMPRPPRVDGVQRGTYGRAMLYAVTAFNDGGAIARSIARDPVHLARDLAGRRHELVCNPRPQVLARVRRDLPAEVRREERWWFLGHVVERLGVATVRLVILRARAGGGDAIHEALLAALRARPVAG